MKFNRQNHYELCWKYQKLKKTPRDVIILSKCTINHDHSLYCSRYMAQDGCRSIFSPFIPQLPKKWKCQKNEDKKAPWDIIIWHKCTKNHDSMLYCSWDMAHADAIVIFHFGLFLPFYPPPPPSIPKNENFKTMKKTHADIIILHKCTKNHGHMLHCSWDIRCVTDVIVSFHFGLFFVLLPL